VIVPKIFFIKSVYKFQICLDKSKKSKIFQIFWSPGHLVLNLKRRMR